MEKERKLYRSSTNKMIAGICGGIGEYFDVDPTVIRLLYIIASIASIGFPGMIAYLILWVVIPDKTKAEKTPE